MGTLTDDQLALKANEDAYSNLKTLRELKTQKADALVALNALRPVITADIAMADWNSYTMTQAMAALGFTKESFRETARLLELIVEANNKTPVITAYLNSVKGSLDDDYRAEIEAELA